MKSGKFDNKTTKKTDSKSIRTFSYTLEINNVSHNFYEVDRIKNVTSDQLPFKNHVSHFQTTRNIRTSELLPLIHKKYGIKSMSIMFNHIDKNGFNDISPYKINMFFCNPFLHLINFSFSIKGVSLTVHYFCVIYIVNRF